MIKRIVFVPNTITSLQTTLLAEVQQGEGQLLEQIMNASSSLTYSAGIRIPTFSRTDGQNTEWM
jgi:hypothetical protein